MDRSVPCGGWKITALVGCVFRFLLPPFPWLELARTRCCGSACSGPPFLNLSLHLSWVFRRAPCTFCPSESHPARVVFKKPKSGIFPLFLLRTILSRDLRNYGPFSFIDCLNDRVVGEFPSCPPRSFSNFHLAICFLCYDFFCFSPFLLRPVFPPPTIRTNSVPRFGCQKSQALASLIFPCSLSLPVAKTS